MKKIEYYFPDGRYVPRGAFTDVADALQKIKEVFEADGIVRCHFQPGDGTRYDFVIINCDTSMVVASLVPQRWINEYGLQGFSTPEYLHEKVVGLKLFPNTVAIVCDVVNYLRQGPKAPEKFFNWVQAVARKI